MAAIQTNGTTRIDNSGRGFFSAGLNPGTSTPGGVTSGDIYYDNSAKKVKVYNGSTWVSL